MAGKKYRLFYYKKNRPERACFKYIYRETITALRNSAQSSFWQYRLSSTIH